jgi:DeoR/GlpR family transcriptional regulator of sugar metabolism
LDKNKKAQVMDLQKVLPDITKRTIRRDLEDLLRASKIMRMGEFNQVFYKIA